MISERDRLLAEREAELARATSSLRQSQDLLIAREAELTGARKQLETLTFQMTGIITTILIYYYYYHYYCNYYYYYHFYYYYYGYYFFYYSFQHLMHVYIMRISIN